MMPQKLRSGKIIILALIIFSALLACSDIFETDIGNTTVVILAPPDGFETSEREVTFWWEEMEGAEGYCLQIVKPDFNYIRDLVLDTNLIDNKLKLFLDTGEYSWRVFAYNTGYTSLFTKHLLRIK